MGRTHVTLGSLWIALLMLGCSAQVKLDQQYIRQQHWPKVQRWITRDMLRHQRGVLRVAQKLAPGFANVAVGAQHAAPELRYALRLMSQPEGGITEMIASPKSFIAAIGLDGKVIARDVIEKHDHMRGMNFKQLFKPVTQALDGHADHGLVMFPSADKKPSLLFAAPAIHHQVQVGAMVVGVPLWRLAQKLSQQLRLHYAKETDLILWVYVLYQDRLQYFATPPELDAVIPKGKLLEQQLKAHPKGFWGEFALYGRLYAYGIFAAPALGPEVGVLIVRSGHQ